MLQVLVRFLICILLINIAYYYIYYIFQYIHISVYPTRVLYSIQVYFFGIIIFIFLYGHIIFFIIYFAYICPIHSSHRYILVTFPYASFILYCIYIYTIVYIIGITFVCLLCPIIIVVVHWCSWHVVQVSIYFHLLVCCSS